MEEKWEKTIVTKDRINLEKWKNALALYSNKIESGGPLTSKDHQMARTKV